MQRHGKWRWAAIIAPPLVALGIATLVACHDRITSNDGAQAPNDVLVTAPSGISATAIRARSHLSERNPHDWVGVAHNRALREFRKEMKKPGVLTRNICDYMLDFIVRADLLPATKPATVSSAQLQAARAGLATTGLCRNRTATARDASWMPLESHAVGLSQESNISPAAYELAYSIEVAVEAATDSYDLAGRLNQVLDAAAALDPVEQEVIGAVVSTAQHSYEYWQSELPTMQQEFANEYSECARQYKQAGSSSDDASAGCLDGGAAESVLPLVPQLGSPTTARFASYGLPLTCDGAGTHFKRLAGADAVGAIVGAVKAAVFGPPGVLAGAFAGGSLGSLASFLKSTWELFWCAM